AISQTNRDIVANRKALRMGGNPIPQPTAVAENKSAAEALKAEMGFGTSTPISAKAALKKRKVSAMEEDDGNNESDYSASNTPIPIPKNTNGVVEDVQDTVRYENNF